MTLTRDDVYTALEVLSARVPDRQVEPSETMAAAWLPDLGKFDRTALFRAAREWGGLRFPSAGEFFAACQESARAIAGEEIAAHSAGELELHACPEMCEGGMVCKTVDGVDFYHPCPRCAPVQFAVWEHRTNKSHFEGCRDCALIRRGGKDEPSWLTEARERASMSPAARKLDDRLRERF